MPSHAACRWPSRTLACIALAAAIVPLSLVAAEPPRDVLVIDKDTVLDPAQTYGRIVVTAPNVTIDGRGAWLIGARRGDPKEFTGEAITAKGVSGVALRNINAKGWETGLHVTDAHHWTVENCDFSDNFHDPAFGWGENGRRGGVILERVANSTLRKCKANRVWDACVLVRSHDNLIEDCDFSHTSNTCLKLWTACRNTIRRCNLSYGLRIDPGEVHARDSTCVLIESGSNDNRLVGNDCTHGGDGIFVRVLNQWVSTGNLFQENDCSYANNNCVEAWSPGSTWIRNKANHGSYGFWLGASDGNVLLENEASFNGLPDGFHNSPHLPDGGHAGIVFMFGPSSHTIVRGNVCERNHGAGIAAIGDLDSKGQKWNAFHWIIEQNELRGNRWGIYLQHAQMIDLAANRFAGNSHADVHEEENVQELVNHPDLPGVTRAPQVKLAGPNVVSVGEEATFDAAGSRDPAGLPLTYRWRIAPADAGAEPQFRHTFRAPGFYRLALTVNNGLLSDLAWRDLYVVEQLAELGTEGPAEPWTSSDPLSQVRFAVDADAHLVGAASIRADVDPYSGGRVTLRYKLPDGSRNFAGKTTLAFWLKTRNEGVPSWQDLNPLVALVGTNGQSKQLAPSHDLLSTPPYNEARDGWTYFAIPLAGDAQWQPTGEAVTDANELHFGFDSWGAPPLVIWIDGLGVK